MEEFPASGMCRAQQEGSVCQEVGRGSAAVCGVGFLLRHKRPAQSIARAGNVKRGNPCAGPDFEVLQGARRHWVSEAGCSVTSPEGADND